jgi:ATP-dependent DNA helicase DinG
MAQALAQGGWDGDRDSLDTPPEPEAWSPVAAEGSSCTGRHCPAFSQCVYYDQRKALVGAQVIVANHDLLLSSLGARVLPELDNCLLVLDEAHHLPATALDQFACSADLSRLTWIDRLSSRALRIGTLVEVSEVADIPRHASQLRQHLQDLARLVMDLYGRGPSRAQNSAWGPGARARAARRAARGRCTSRSPSSRTTRWAFLECLRAHLQGAAQRDARQARRGEGVLSAALCADRHARAPARRGARHGPQLLLQEAPEGRNAGFRAQRQNGFTLEMDGDFIVVKAHASPHPARQHAARPTCGAACAARC